MLEPQPSPRQQGKGESQELGKDTCSLFSGSTLGAGTALCLQELNHMTPPDTRQAEKIQKPGDEVCLMGEEVGGPP